MLWIFDPQLSSWYIYYLAGPLEIFPLFMIRKVINLEEMKEEVKSGMNPFFFNIPTQMKTEFMVMVKATNMWSRQNYVITCPDIKMLYYQILIASMIWYTHNFGCSRQPNEYWHMKKCQMLILLEANRDNCPTMKTMTLSNFVSKRLIFYDYGKQLD